MSGHSGCGGHSGRPGAQPRRALACACDAASRAGWQQRCAGWPGAAHGACVPAAGERAASHAWVRRRRCATHSRAVRRLPRRRTAAPAAARSAPAMAASCACARERAGGELRRARWCPRVPALALLLLACCARSARAAFVCGAANDDATCAALAEVWTATGGAGWATKTGWATAATSAGGADYCTFYGVTCATGSTSIISVLCVCVAGGQHAPCGSTPVWTVTHCACSPRRILGDNQLSGSIPAGIGNLTGLKEL
jgi:hypothetical protein